MFRITLISTMAAVLCLLVSFPVQSQESDRQLDVRARLAETELYVKTHELELKMAELAVDEARLEVEKIKLRAEATRNGLDPNVWFGHVEVVAARRVGKEPVRYVSNITKYHLAFSAAEARLRETGGAR